MEGAAPSAAVNEPNINPHHGGIWRVGLLPDRKRRGGNRVPPSRRNGTYRLNNGGRRSVGAVNEPNINPHHGGIWRVGFLPDRKRRGGNRVPPSR